MKVRKFILKNNLLRLCYQLSSIIVFLPLSILFSFFKKDNRTWFFAHRHGYTDNAREFFEYVSCNVEGITAVWLASSEEELSQIPSDMNGVLVYKFDSIKLLSKAGCFFLSTGFADFPRFCPCFRVKYYQLWHGWPIKKVGLKSKETFPFNNKVLNKALSKLLELNWNRIDAFFCHNDYMAKVISDSFSLPMEKCISSGWPRYNRILDSKLGSSCLKTYLYAPTWHKDKSILLSCLSQLMSNEFLFFMRKEKAKLKIKLHPLDRFLLNCKDTESVEFVDGNTIDLIDEADIVISDYSSLLIDASINNKKIFIFCTDLSNYSHERGIEDKFIQDYQSYHASSITELIYNIENSHSPNWNFGRALNSNEKILSTILKQNNIKSFCIN